MTSDPPRSMLGRACAAVALTAGFYTLALGLAAALIVGPLYLWATNGHGNVWVTIAAFVAGFTILKALVPERERFDAPGPELTAAAQPELFAELGAVADAVGEPLPPHIYLDGDVNASVAEISNGLLQGRRRIMILGLPLLAALTPQQLRAVIAHEYGHYVGGDTRFSAWIWRTRVAVLKTVHALDTEDSWFQRVIVRTPFLLYAKLFLRLTNAISRRAEFAADAIAARIAGAQPHAEALRSLSAAAPAYTSYWHDEVAFALERGRRPPIAAGFHGFLASHEIRAQVDEVVAAEIDEAETNPYDSHPTLADRLRAVGEQPTGQVSLPAAPDSAAALLRDVEALESAVLACRYGAEAIGRLEAIGWDQTGELYALDGERIAEQHGEAFAGLTVAGAAIAATTEGADLPRLRRALGDESHATQPEQLMGFWRFALGRLVLAALHRDGWTIQSPPGEPLVCRRGDDVIEVYRSLARATEDALSASEWQATCERLGVADLPLVPQHANGTATAAASGSWTG